MPREAVACGPGHPRKAPHTLFPLLNRMTWIQDYIFSQVI
ncbi:hypothetical protein ACP4OV_027152 [Aristida adscensionis]